MREYSEKEFSELLPSLDIQSVVDAETFGIVMAEDEQHDRKDIKNNLMIELDDISTKIKYGLNALSSVHFAMEDETCTADSYTDGLFFVYDCLAGQVERLEKCIGALKEQIRRETK